MPVTPEEYAAKELHVPGWDDDEQLYAPGSNPSEQGFDPNILRVMNGGAPVPESTPEPVDPQTVEMAFEYNFTLPLELRRAELATESSKLLHLNARTFFWSALSLAILATPILAFIAVLVK